MNGESPQAILRAQMSQFDGVEIREYVDSVNIKIPTTDGKGFELENLQSEEIAGLLMASRGSGIFYRPELVFSEVAEKEGKTLILSKR